MESDTVIYGLLGRIHLLMRRIANRITDVEYMRVNPDYAREIVRIGEATGNPEMLELCGRLRQAMVLDPPAVEETAPSGGMLAGMLERMRAVRPNATHPVERYVGSLR